nr:ubiquitin carboxyl-terminal hydrolase isozyme L3-like [Cherax quadricarinatus]
MVRWLPLESNPAVMNKFLAGLGVPASWTIHDVYGLEEEMLNMVPQPVCAVILLYPFIEKAPDREDVVNEHFIALVEVEGNLYELDGRRKFPVNHGPTSADTLLQVS